MLTVGFGCTVNVSSELAVPNGVMIEISPLVPIPMVAVIFDSETMVKELTLVPPILTAVAAARFAPLIVKVAVDAQPDVGVKEAM